MAKIALKDKNICASKWSAMFDIPVSSLIIAVELGLIRGNAGKYRCDIPESEGGKIESLREILQNGNLIQGASRLGEFLVQYGGKKSWGKEFAGLITKTPAFLGYISTVIHRNAVNVPVFSKKDIDVEVIERFINSKKTVVSRNKAIAKQKSARKIKELHESLKTYKENLKQDINAIRSYHPFLYVALHLYHLNHYTKTDKYSKHQDMLYRLKKAALLKALSEYPDLFSLSFVKRGDRVIYCDSCREDAIELRNEFGYWRESWLDFAGDPCPSCRVEKDYYSLVEFAIKTPIVSFVYHIPYPLVSHIRVKDLPVKTSSEEGGWDTYGRPLLKYEAMLFPLKTVVKVVQSYIDNPEKQSNKKGG